MGEIKVSDSVSVKSSTSTNQKQKEEEFTISVNDFENEFARRYRVAINANDFGFKSVKELMDSLQTNSKISFGVVIKTKIVPFDEFNKNNLKLNIDNSQSINNSNVTSPQFINSPSNYSNHSYSAYKQNNGSNVRSSNSSNSSQFVSYPNNVDNNGQIAQLMQYYQQNANNLQNKQSFVTVPYVLNSVGNYSVIPSVPNSLITASIPNSFSSQPNALLNTINMNINMQNLQNSNVASAASVNPKIVGSLFNVSNSHNSAK